MVVVAVVVVMVVVAVAVVAVVVANRVPAWRLLGAAQSTTPARKVEHGNQEGAKVPRRYGQANARKQRPHCKRLSTK